MSLGTSALPTTPYWLTLARRVCWSEPEPRRALADLDTLIRQTMDYGCVEDVLALEAQLGRARLCAALLHARPGQVSRGAHATWTLLLGLRSPQQAPPPWPDRCHLHDAYRSARRRRPFRRPRPGATRNGLQSA